MSLTPSSSSLKEASSKYQELVDLFRQANQKNLPQELNLDVILKKCMAIRVRIRNLNEHLPTDLSKDKLFPSTITTREQLLEDVNQKVKLVYQKQLASKPSLPSIEGPFSSFFDFKGNSFSMGSSFPMVLDGTVGYANIGNNCWISSLLQVSNHIPHLKTALQEVGAFYTEGHSFDKIHMDDVLHNLQSESPSTQNIEDAVASYRQIQAPIVKLKAIRSLIDMHIPPHVLRQFLVPGIYRDLIRMLMGPKKPSQPTSEEITVMFSQAVDHILLEELTGYDAWIAQRKRCGQHLVDALSAYDRNVLEGRSVSWQVGQNVRLAFHHLFNSCSSDMYRSEDCLEGIAVIMREYEKILMWKKTFPAACYFTIETTRSYVPDPKVQPSRYPIQIPLKLGKYSTTEQRDHQIRLTFSQPRYPSLEDLLQENCRMPDYGEGTYCLPNKQIQTYRCTEVRTLLNEAPQQLSIGLNRFIGNAFGAEKRCTPVGANRVIAIPPEMTLSGIPHAYFLSGFVVHRGPRIHGGHYVSYCLIHNETSGTKRWIEYNDARVRYVGEEEIDNILHQRIDRTHTPYFFYYTRVEEQSQQQMLLEAIRLRGKPRNVEDNIQQQYGDQKPLVECLKTIQEILKSDTPDVGQLKIAFKALEKENPQYVRLIYRIIAIHHKQTSTLFGQTLFEKDPLILKAITTRWISQSGVNLIEQLYIFEKRWLDQMEYAMLWRSMDHFMNVLNSKNLDKEAESFVKLYDSLPEILKKEIESQLLKEDSERLAFDSSRKEGTLQAYMLKILTEHPERDLSQIASRIDGQGDKLYALQIRESLRNYLALLQNKNLTTMQLLEAFKLLPLEEEMKEKLFLHVCNVTKTLPSYKNGEALFMANPLILAQPAILEKGITAKGDEATIIGYVAASLKL